MKPKRWDMLRFLDDYQIPHNAYSNISTSGFTATRCPYCGEEEYMGCSLDSLWFTCWGCNGPSNPYDVLQRLTGETFIQPILKKYGNIATTNYIPKYNEEEIKRPTKITQPSSGEWSEKLLAWDYLERERGFDPNILIPKYNLTYTTHGHNEWSYRIIIPFYRNGKLISYQGRSFNGDEIRYRMLRKTEEVYSVKDTFYNIDNSGENVLLVEGVMDVWRLSNAKSVIASCGISLSKRQIRELQTRYKNVFILFDCGEKEAQERAEEVAVMVSSVGTNAEVISFGKDIVGDPDDLLRGKEDTDVIHLAKELKLY